MRYNSTSRLDAGTRFGTSDTVHKIRLAVSSGVLQCRETTLTESQRLDVLAGIEYGDSNYWWAIAAASNIGWGLQVPPGTRILIPDIKYIRENF